MSINRRAATLGLALAGLAAISPLARGAALPPADAADVARVIAYLEGLTTDRGRFTQTDPRGVVTRGTFYLQRPGRARFDYDPPSGLVIASDGHEVTVVDRRLKTVRAYPLSMTPLGLFLARDIRLDRGVEITSVTRGAGTLMIVATEGHRKNAGTIALDFTDPPLALTGWALTDSRGGVVTVRLEGLDKVEPRDAAFFKLADPRPTANPGAAP